jgi:WD40 repeat protein
MGDTFDKILVEYKNKCPIHNIPYSGVCVEKNCYETGIICSKCTPKTCVELLGHKKMTTDEFFKAYIKNLINSVDFKALNDLISAGQEVQEKQLELQAEAFEVWEIEMINQKFDKFREHMNQKIKDFTNKLIEKMQKIYDDFAQSKEAIESSNIEMPDLKLETTIKFLNENKDNKEELEKFLENIKKFMDNDKLIKSQKDLKNLIYGKYLFEHLKTYETNLEKINSLKTEINEFILKLIKCIFPEHEPIKIYTNQSTVDFLSNPQELKFKETITNKCLKSFTIDSIFDAYTAFDGNAYLASSLSSSYNIEIYNLQNNSLQATLKGLYNQLYIIRHYAQYSTNTDYLLSTTTGKTLKIWNLKTYTEYLTIKNCHSGAYMYSALLLFDEINKKNYVVTSSPNDYIKLWNFEDGKFIHDVGTKSDYTYFINSWCHDSKYYIINANADNVKIYGIDKVNDLFGEYTGKQRTWHMSAFVEKINDIDTLFESDGNGYVRLWNLENNSLMKNIYCPSCSLRGLCLWNQQYVIVASSDKSFKIIDFVKEKCVNSIVGQHYNSLCSVKKIKHPKYGESLLSGSIDGSIKLWINNKLI